MQYTGTSATSVSETIPTSRGVSWRLVALFLALILSLAFAGSEGGTPERETFELGEGGPGWAAAGPEPPCDAPVGPPSAQCVGRMRVSGIRLETWPRGSAGSAFCLRARPSGPAGSATGLGRNVENKRFWLPDTLETPWSAPDKKLHFLACYSVVLTGRVTSGELRSGVIAAATLSVAKELWDAWFKVPASHRGASSRDLVADALGICTAAAVVEWFGE